MTDQYIINASDLSSVADTIRAKTGETGELSFPEGFNTAIAGIQTGGATEPYIEETYDANGELIDAKMHGYTTIRSEMFYNCYRLTLTSLPDGITSIGNYAFNNCSNLALTSLPEGITSIGNSAFYNCSNLALASLPEGITSIEGYAFDSCKSLVNITFEGTPASIHQNAFSGCTNLTTINVPWAEGAVANAPWGATNATINYNYTGNNRCK